MSKLPRYLRVDIPPPIDEEGLLGDPTSKVSIIDVDLDGKYEMCFGGRGGRLHIINGDGSVKWIWMEPKNQTMHGASQAFDVDGNGYVEFFLNTNDGPIHRVDIDPEHGPTLTWACAQCGKRNQGHPAVCDLDQDGEYDVIWGSQDFKVYCISRIPEGRSGGSIAVRTSRQEASSSQISMKTVSTRL